MDEQTKYRIFLGNYIPDLGSPIVIITAANFNNMGVCSEYYIVFSGDGKLLLRKQYHLSLNQDQPQAIKIDVDAMMNITKHLAEEKVNAFLMQRYQERKQDWFWQYTLDMKDTDENFLISLYWGSSHNDKLVEIKRSSDCRLLGSFIENLFKLPKLSVRD